MQQSQRESHNPWLEYAIRRANELGKPGICGFDLYAEYSDASLRHFAMQDMLKTGYMHNYMRASGLESKFDTDSHVNRVESIQQEGDDGD